MSIDKEIIEKLRKILRVSDRIKMRLSFYINSLLDKKNKIMSNARKLSKLSKLSGGEDLCSLRIKLLPSF